MVLRGIMKDSKLPKANKNNNVQKYDKKEVVVKKSQEKKNIIPKVKKYLVQVRNTGKNLCISSTKELVKLSGNALKIIGNKLANINWGKLLLNLLKELFATTEEPQTNYYTKTNRDKVYTKIVKRPNPSIHKTEQIETSKIEKIESKKQTIKQINASKKKCIENKERNTKKIVKKENKNILRQQNHLMLENKSKKKD